MDNPFNRRATEQLRDDEAFLAIVSPEPVTFFLRRPAQAGTLYDRLVLIRGTPGSGKTTLARLFEFSALTALLRNTGSSSYEALAGALADCGAIVDGRPRLLGCRLPMETDYRDFWEFPYPESLKAGMLATFVQARAVLAWFRHLAAAGIDSTRVSIVARADSGVAADTIGGIQGPGLFARATEVERAVYDVVGALVAPREDSLEAAVTGAYRPFDVIERIAIAPAINQKPPGEEFLPLVILDDAHSLHPAQFRAMEHWLARRELRIARWLITRFDILQPSEALAAVTEDRTERPDYPGLSASRDVESVLLQSTGARKDQRTAFRRMTRDMAGRYLQKHSLLGPRRLVALPDLLGEDQKVITPSELRTLQDHVGAAQRRLHVTDARRNECEGLIDDFRREGQIVPEDLRLAMLSILIHRYAKRRKNQGVLFADDSEPSRPLVVNQGVYEAARLHLMHRFDRPFFFGIDDLSDASSENAELFLQLSAILVDTVATQVIRSKPPLLTAEVQHLLLRQRGQRIIDAWSFPFVDRVRNLVTGIAKRCVEVSLEPNGWLTPNAFGILQQDFDTIASQQPDLARVLQFAVAYNAILVVPRYECKNKEWCLLELGGILNLAHGLTLKRGGFIEGGIGDLGRMIEGSTV